VFRSGEYQTVYPDMPTLGLTAASSLDTDTG
jgi:hypothetical protein